MTAENANLDQKTANNKFWPNILITYQRRKKYGLSKYPTEIFG